ncbi:MAG: imidazoleglycerol-phosphate dehydratase HisB [Ruminococcaceae bacterium]|nr:imidazoleglycerol-phosphate dehydratase HisB [Oscillospiraceae bacterium]
MRTSSINRNTAETQIALALNLDGKGNGTIDTGCGFLDHMLTLFSKHSRFDLDVKCKGDVQVDFHHTAEDIGIALGKAFAEALGDKRGITRYADTTLPMDETLILSAVDISGRAYLSYNAPCLTTKVGDFDTELSEEFWMAFVREAGITLHITKLAGTNSHHIIEGVFKSVARTLRKAVKTDPELEGEVPSTKGVL